MLLQKHTIVGHRAQAAGGCRSRAVVCRSAAAKLSKRAKYAGTSRRNDPLVVTVNPDGSDAWRVDEIVQELKNGAVGVIPTDTLPAIVCDLHNKDAVVRLYAVKQMDAKKPLSILCPNLSSIAHYTTGFPSTASANWFNVAKRLLPGPYTFVLPATKNLPSQCVDFIELKRAHRKSVGVRIPDDKICQAILDGFGGPLLCTSVHVPEHLAPDTEVPDCGSILEAYGERGIDFVVDPGRRVAWVSSVVDFTSGSPEVLRRGQGDTSAFEEE